MDHICITIKSSKEGKSTVNGRGKYVYELNKPISLIDTIASNSGYWWKSGLVVTYSLTHSHTPNQVMLSHLKIHKGRRKYELLLNQKKKFVETDMLLLLEIFKRPELVLCSEKQKISSNESMGLMANVQSKAWKITSPV